MLRGLFGGAAAMALILSAGLASAQDFSAERLSEGIRHISSDDFQGRYPGTEGERMTLAWLQAQYEEMGLEPGGPNGQWLQDVVLKRFTPVAGAASASWTGPDGTVHPMTVGTDITLRAATNGTLIDLGGADAANTLLFLEAVAKMGEAAASQVDAPAAARWLARTLGAPAEILIPVANPE